MTIRKVASAATTNSTLLAAGKVRLDRIVLSNNTALGKWLKFYDKATAPTMGTDVPIATFQIPANGVLSLSSLGIYGLLGLGFGITAVVNEGDTTATAVNDVVGIIQYNTAAA